MFKWLFDKGVSLIGLLLLWPVLLIVAVLEKIKMPGEPAFFVQKRVGKDGRLFKCHKFRSMTVKPNLGIQVIWYEDHKEVPEILRKIIAPLR